MQTVQEFMQCYFRERTELRRAWLAHGERFRQRFFTTDYLREHQSSNEEIRSFQKANPAGSMDIADSGSLALVATTEPFGKRQKRFRYHLQRSGETWLVQRHEWECLVCKATGNRGTNQCDNCTGTGWKYYGPADG